MFQLLIRFVLYIITSISSLIFTPIIELFTNIFPDFGLLITNIQAFLTTYVFQNLQWTKMFLINSTAFPPQLFELLVTLFGVFIIIHATMVTYKGIMNLYTRLKP